MQQKEINEEFVKKTYLTNSNKFCKPKSELRRAQLKRDIHYKKKDVDFDKVFTFLMDKVFCFSIEEQQLVKKELANANKRRKFTHYSKPLQQRPTKEQK